MNAIEIIEALRRTILDAHADESFDALTCDAGGVIFGDIASEALEEAETFIAQNR